MGPSGHIEYILHILDCLGQDMQVLYLGRAPRTKETLPDFLKWRRVTRPPLVFRGLTGSQRTPGFWGVTKSVTNRSQICDGILNLSQICYGNTIPSHFSNRFVTIL